MHCSRFHFGYSFSSVEVAGISCFGHRQWRVAFQMENEDKRCYHFHLMCAFQQKFYSRISEEAKCGRTMKLTFISFYRIQWNILFILSFASYSCLLLFSSFISILNIAISVYLLIILASFIFNSVLFRLVCQQPFPYNQF